MKFPTKIKSISGKWKDSLLFERWNAMLARCYNKKGIGYARYGGRGIKVCDQWRNDFQSFANWAMSNGFSKRLQIDRINNEGDYEPSNCRFVTNRENGRNTRTFKGGVGFHKYNKMYRAQIKFCGKKIHLGYFKNKIDARIAYERASQLADMGINPKSAKQVAKVIEAAKRVADGPFRQDYEELCQAMRDLDK